MFHSGKKRILVLICIVSWVMGCSVHDLESHGFTFGVRYGWLGTWIPPRSNATTLEEKLHQLNATLAIVQQGQKEGYVFDLDRTRELTITAIEATREMERLILRAHDLNRFKSGMIPLWFELIHRNETGCPT